MATIITVKQMAAAKRIAANVLPLTNKKAKIGAKIIALGTELDNINAQIDAQQGYVKSFAAGLTTEQLVIRDEKGAFQPNPEVLAYDEDKHYYVVKEESAEEEAAKAAAEAAAADADEAARVAAEEEAAREAAAKEAAPENPAGGDNDPWGGEQH